MAMPVQEQAKNIYRKMKDENNAKAVEKFINQAQEFIKFESQNAEKLKQQEINYSEQLKQQQMQAQQELSIKETEIKAQQQEMEKEEVIVLLQNL